jgi:hypothetical protein
MSDLAQFTALIIGGFGLFAFMFQRLEIRLDNRIDRVENEIKALRSELGEEGKALRLAEEFRAQRAEVAAQTSALANAIIASRPA